jgi:DNA-binding transcriptional LysR family regulator
MFDLNAIADFIAVVRAQSFAGAARATRTPKSTLSKRIQALEEQLKTRLIERSTRSMRLTASGQAFYERALRIIAEVEDAQNFLAAQSKEPQGLLRVSAPVLFGQVFMGGVSARYVRQYPKTQMDIVLVDRRVDVVEENIEAAIRIGVMQDSSLISRSFAKVSHILVAAPKFAKTASITSPQEAANFSCIAHAVDAQARSTWRFMQGLRVVEVVVDPKITATSMFAVKHAAIEGAGFAFLPRFFVSEDLKAKRLVDVLPYLAGPTVPISIVYPSSRFLNPRLRSFIDLLVEEFQGREI